MFSSRRQFVITAIIAIASMVGIACRTAEAAKGPAPKEVRVEGRLVSGDVTARTVVVRVSNGSLVTLTIPATAKVERNGRKATLVAFKVNDRVEARFAPGSTVVVKFEGVGP